MIQLELRNSLNKEQCLTHNVLVTFISRLYNLIKTKNKIYSKKKRDKFQFAYKNYSGNKFIQIQQ